MIVPRISGSGSMIVYTKRKRSEDGPKWVACGKPGRLSS